jgi:hypothetical protein
MMLVGGGGVLPHRANETGGERQTLLAPGQQVHHGGGEPVLWGVGEPLLRRRALGLARLAGSRARGAADALAGESRRSGPDCHRGADEGGHCLQGSPSETSNRGHGRGGCGVGGGQGNRPSGGRDDGGGAADPEGLCGGRNRKCLQGLLVAAARGAAAPSRNRWRRRRVLRFVLTPERVAALAPSRPAGASGPDSVGGFERRHWS